MSPSGDAHHLNLHVEPPSKRRASSPLTEETMKQRLMLLGSALATTAVFAGTYAAIDQPSSPSSDMTGATTVTANETVIATPQQTVTTSETTPLLAPTAEPTPLAEPAKIAVPVAAPPQPPITITEQRLTEDERIKAEVMDALARMERASGKVGVETNDRVVMLSGWLTTSGQVSRAGREAGKVTGVRYVVNEIRPRIGSVTN
jgi:hypothetical protein